MLWLLGFGIGNQVSYIVVISVVLVKNMTNKKQIFGSAVSILENQTNLKDHANNSKQCLTQKQNQVPILLQYV